VTAEWEVIERGRGGSCDDRVRISVTKTSRVTSRVAFDPLMRAD
jgi:hypothetical protein